MLGYFMKERKEQQELLMRQLLDDANIPALWPQVTVLAFWGHFDGRNRPKKFLNEHSDMFLMPPQLKGRLQSH